MYVISGSRKQTRPKDVVVQSDEFEGAKFLWLNESRSKASPRTYVMCSKENGHSYVDSWIYSSKKTSRVSAVVWQTSAKHPVVIPRNTHFIRLLITAIHEGLFHAGPRHVLAAKRQEVWIPHRLPVAKATLKCCSLCRLVAGKGFRRPQMAPLPSDRVNVSKPFTSVGFDYFGPINVLEPISRNVCKVRVGLFTCESTRAIHMKTVDTCVVESCI